ncbi:Uncharacterized protein Adt_23993 [Abeliophyllum distichum]|uniref:Uncharacterized protein n=1 Tax=Abeliophyllum distichum TaxID=126358 RepID=A0ABD1SF82_9LAMI
MSAGCQGRTQCMASSRVRPSWNFAQKFVRKMFWAATRPKLVNLNRESVTDFPERVGRALRPERQSAAVVGTGQTAVVSLSVSLQSSAVGASLSLSSLFSLPVATRSAAVGNSNASSAVFGSGSSEHLQSCRRQSREA